MTRKPSRPQASARVLALLAGVILLGAPLAARAVDLNLKFEPGVSLPVSRPQADRFHVGGAASLKGLLGFDESWFSVAASLTFLGLPAQSGFANGSTGTAWSPGIGVRIQRPRESEIARLHKPHAAETLMGAKPWFDGDLLYVRTGGLDRAGFAAGAGVSFPIGEARSFALGPFVRYLQIFQPNRAGFDNKDSKSVILGVSLEWGTRLERPLPATAASEARPAQLACPAAVECPAAPECPPEVIAKVCPAVTVDKVLVKPGKLELKEKIQFLRNQAVIEQVSQPLLDQVAQVLKDNPNFRVQVEGHSSSEGGDERNQTLSEQRARAVLDYLANRGIAPDRLLSKGFSSSQPIDTNETQSGREANRRVEFVVSFIILKEGSAR